MLDTILATKEKSSQTFIGATRVPVTWVKVGSCVVTQVKKPARDGYWAVQLGFGEKKIKNISKPLLGHLRNVVESKKVAPRFLREVKLDKEPELKVGDVIAVSDIFRKGDVVQVTGISKGKGFAGVVKRWGFSGGPRTHGQSDRERAPGSIGQGTTPGRVWKGKKMAGRMGGRKVTVKNLVVVDIQAEENLLAISGLLPGQRGSLLIIKRLGSGKIEELEEKAPEVQVVQEEEESETNKNENESAEINSQSQA